MTDRIPIKAIISSGAAVALGEFEPADRVSSDYLSLPNDYISGLRMEWVSNNSIRIGTGSAYVQSLDRILSVSSSITKSSLSLSPDTWFHIYLFNNSGSVDIEVVITAPSVEYNGTARSKTGDASRRYIGSVRTLSSSYISKFSHNVEIGQITYLEDINTTPFRVVSGGVAVVATSVSCSDSVPITSRVAKFLSNNNATGAGQLVYMSNSDAINPLSSSYWMSFINPSGSFYADFPLDSSGSFNYMYAVAPTGGMVFIRVVGYLYER